MNLLNFAYKIDGALIKSSYYYNTYKMLGIPEHYTFIAFRVTFKRLTLSIY